MSHFIRKCECGAVLAQCRCMSLDKKVEYVRPCVHYFTTHSVASFEPISLEQLYAVYMEYLEGAPRTPNVLKVHPSVYKAILEYFEEQEVQERLMGIKKPEESAKTYALGKIFGTQIIIDHSLKPGEWKFEDIHPTNRGTYSEEELKRLAARILSEPLHMGADEVAKRNRITGLQTS